MSKVRDSAYASGRGNSWVKKTCVQRETLTIDGFALDEGKWDGIYVGRRKGKDLIYAGKVDHGFDKSSAADLQKRLKPLIRKTQPYGKRIAHKGIWVEPKLLPARATINAAFSVSTSQLPAKLVSARQCPAASLA